MLSSQAVGGSAPAPQTLGTFAQQVLNALVPDQESILKLAGMAGNGAAQTERVPGEGDSGCESHFCRVKHTMHQTCSTRQGYH